MNNVMLQKWRELLDGWAIAPVLADDTFMEICDNYASSGRFYHTLDHIQNVLGTVEGLRSHARNFNAVRLAAWLHDIIYDSRASNNEERSAAFAEQICKKLVIPDGDLVAALILKTKTHDAGDDPNAQMLLDADLAILGESESVYRTYAQNIRWEYEWVPEPEYRTGRRRVLERFMARPRIFQFLDHLEESARRNIAVEIAELTPV